MAVKSTTLESRINESVYLSLSNSNLLNQGDSTIVIIAPNNPVVHTHRFIDFMIFDT